MGYIVRGYTVIIIIIIKIIIMQRLTRRVSVIRMTNRRRISVHNQPTRSTQLCISPGTGVAKSSTGFAGVKVGTPPDGR